jgi:rSAM/selenodomain-associated transferase 1
LILFMKAPRLGQVNTRLQPELMPEESLMLYRAMVEDTVSQFDDVGFCDVKIFFYPQDAKDEMEHWLGDHFEYFPQHGADLGEKLHNAIAEMLNQKYDKVVLVGSDIPTLDSTTIVRAFTNLNDYDVALGPSKDGGYYLIGMKKPYPTLFQEMDWSTSIVLQQTIQKARQAQLDIVQLEVKSDIDSYDEVVELWNYLKKRNMNGVYSYKSKTYQVLKKLFEKEYVPNYS